MSIVQLNSLFKNTYLLAYGTYQPQHSYLLTHPRHRPPHHNILTYHNRVMRTYRTILLLTDVCNFFLEMPFKAVPFYSTHAHGFCFLHLTKLY